MTGFPTPSQRVPGSGFAPLRKIVTASTDYTVPLGVRCVLVDTSTTAVTVTLPSCTLMVGDVITVKHDVQGNACTVKPHGSETIDGGTQDVLAHTAAIQYIARHDGKGWARI